MAVMEKSFNSAVNLELDNLIHDHADYFKKEITIHHDNSATENFSSFAEIDQSKTLKLYVIIDGIRQLRQPAHQRPQGSSLQETDDGRRLLKTFFKVLKEGRKTGTIHNVYITGVLPITIDELASGFNIANFITLNPTFENMLGFTQTEVNALLDEIYADYGFDPATRSQTDAVIKTNYDGYHL